MELSALLLVANEMHNIRNMYLLRNVYKITDIWCNDTSRLDEHDSQYNQKK